MLLSNYTFSVNLSHGLLFEQFLRTDVKDFFKEQALVKDYKSYKLLTETNQDGLTVSMQLFFVDTEAYMEFELNFQNDFFDLLDQKFSSKYVYFKSLLEEH